MTCGQSSTSLTHSFICPLQRHSASHRIKHTQDRGGYRSQKAWLLLMIIDGKLITFFAIKLKLGNHLPFRRCYLFLSDHVLFLRVWFPALPSSSSQAPRISTPGNKTSTPNLMGNRTQPHTALYLSTPTQIHIKIKIRLKFIKRWFLNWLLDVRAKALNRKRTQTSLSRHWGQRKPEQGKKSFSTFFKSK